MTPGRSAESTSVEASTAPANLRPVCAVAGFEKADEVADRTVAMPGVTKRQLAVDLVAVAASVAGLCQVARLLEVVDDVGGRPLGDADTDGDVSEPGIGIGPDAFEHVGVVRHKSPQVFVSST